MYSTVALWHFFGITTIPNIYLPQKLTSTPKNHGLESRNLQPQFPGRKFTAGAVNGDNGG